MNADILFFFQEHMAVLPMYEKLEALLLEQIPDLKIKVSKTQISFSNKRGIAFVSFNPARKANARPAVWMTVTFGLNEQKLSPRIDAAVEPYPNRWTHHVTVGSVDEVDDELLGWIGEAAAFSENKR